MADEFGIDENELAAVPMFESIGPLPEFNHEFGSCPAEQIATTVHAVVAWPPNAPVSVCCDER